MRSPPAILGAPVSGAPVFEDAFTSDPAAGGWTEDADGGSITHNGTDAVFSGDAETTQTITRTISTAGRADVYAHFTATANAASEFNDIFTFLVDSNDDGTFESVASANASGASFENLDPTPLPTAAVNNSNLPIRMTWEHNNAGEDGYLDHLTLFEAPDVIASDPFDLDPASNGWTESGGTVESNGDGTVSLQGTPSSSITKTFDFSKVENILVELEGINDGYNANDDQVILEIDSGSGFVEAGVHIGTDSPYTLGALLPTDAENNSSVALRLIADSSFSGQDTKFDQLTIRGLVIPEPSTALLLLLGASAFLTRRPRRRK